MSNPERYEGKIKEEFGENLRELIERNHLTEKQFGESIGYSQSTINNLINGTSYPSSNFLFAIKEKYHVSIDQMIGNNFKILTYADLLRYILSIENNIIVEAKKVMLNGKLGESHCFYDTGSPKVEADATPAVALVFSDEQINSYLFKWLDMRERLYLKKDEPEYHKMLSDTFNDWRYKELKNFQDIPVVKRIRYSHKRDSNKKSPH